MLLQNGVPVVSVDRMRANGELRGLARWIRALRPEARTALVLGFGGGYAAQTLASARFDVETAGLEPQVAALMQQHFALPGSIGPSDASAALMRAPGSVDVVLGVAGDVDALEDDVLLEGGLGAACRLVGPAGLVALELLASPTSEIVARAASQLTNPLLLGEGTGQEKQTLYLFGCGGPLEAAGGLMNDAWPLPVPGLASPGPTGDALVFGYLFRALEDDILYLDAPQDAPGGTVYRLVGGEPRGADPILARARLTKLDLPRHHLQPREGTLVDVVGGGREAMSWTRFSSVALAVEGQARLVAAYPWQSREKHPVMAPGGALYEVTSPRVVGALTLSDWNRGQGARARCLASLGSVLRRAELTSAAERGRACLQELVVRHGPIIRRTRYYDLLSQLSELMADEGRALGPPATPFLRGAACHRLLEQGWFTTDMDDDRAAVVLALLDGAKQSYLLAAQGSTRTPEARDAARHLLALYEDELSGAFSRRDLELTVAGRTERDSAQLRSRFPEIERADGAPKRPVTLPAAP